jgi:hypothetical protein
VIPTRTIPDSTPRTGFVLLHTHTPTFWLVARLEEPAQKSRLGRSTSGPRRVLLHQIVPRTLIRRPFERMPSTLAQTCFGSLVLLRNSYSRIAGPRFRRTLGVGRTTSTSHSKINSHRTYTSITPRSRSRHRYRVQPNHLTQQTEWQPTTTTSSERQPHPQSSLHDLDKREKFAKRRRRKDEEPDRVREGFMGMSWKASLSLLLPLFLLLPLPLLAIFIHTYLHYLPSPTLIVITTPIPTTITITTPITSPGGNVS